MSNKYLYITLLSVLGFSEELTAQVVTQAPKLVVSITVDELRTDELETFSPLYSPNGLKRLLQDGTFFTNASYPFTPVDRASAAASLSTGSTPYYHGITGAEWLDRSTLRPVRSVHDLRLGYSPKQLGASTLGDELKIATNGIAKVFAFAATPENAILSAGHAADGAAWMQTNQWVITSFYEPTNQWLRGYTRLYQPSADTNASVTEIALDCLNGGGLALDDKTDLLSVGYSVDSQMESYVALDRAIAQLVDSVSKRIPLDRVLFVLTSTGTRRVENEQNNNEKYRIPTGKFYINRTANLLNMYLGATYGTAQYVEAIYRNQLFIDHKLLERKNINLSDMLRRAQEFILQLSGVRHVYTANQLTTSDSNLLSAIRNGFNVEKCGDLIIDIAPGWELVNENDHTSTTSRASNIPFPIIFYGAGIKSQRVQTPVTVDAIAPTIARIIRIRAPNACSTEPLF
ncbi:Type I phosphodiesterase / nucleotide pyrophosphatase [Prevotellaceae bacterium HUN156]|jgi:hypothetical protein|nr:Type I phosphodiesterase / nucleotide pyrophosphatase [Prevotellaceae bacterium HUN156]